jgi:hypothetical protein
MKQIFVLTLAVTASTVLVMVVVLWLAFLAGVWALEACQLLSGG